MGRIHLFEFEDLDWFPSTLRDYGTDFLQYGATKFDLYRNITSILEKGVKNSGTSQVIDLASGGGGGLVKLNQHLREKIPDLKILLTDYYPNISAFEFTKKKCG